VRVLSVDTAHRRLGLSLRQAHKGNGLVDAPGEIEMTPPDLI